MKAATGAAGQAAAPGDTGGGTAPVSRRQTMRAIVQAGYGTYPLRQAPDAMRHLQAGHARGKLVLDDRRRMSRRELLAGVRRARA